MRQSTRVTALSALAVVGIAAFLTYWQDLFVLIFPMPHGCYTEVLGRLSGISGHDFEISDTTCKTLASDDAITIFVSRPGETGKVAVFKYDPGNTELPAITAIDQHTVLISVRFVASTYFSKVRWQGLSIEYDIGTIQFPDKDDPPIRRRSAP